ncbi:helix-turn-helix domain-containing protein [Streptomyces sp. A0642]|uniref:helix-turn-helix domain-containing protein n=1 Tax=Streptomyces sp. A0642 TaxID=2563100 RepID=UPI0023F3172B|nr:helix-turn-helix domain-containing protein [Streptomyces sp. A0642]
MSPCKRGTANAVVARMLRLHLDTVRRWRKRFTAEGLAAVEDRPGRPRRYGGEVHLAIVATVTGASRLVPAARGCALTGKAPPGDQRQSGRRAGWPS